MANAFLTDLCCMVCNQMPIELKECKSCNKILCTYCKKKIEQKSKIRKCPSCNDDEFVFQDIKNKLVKTLFVNMKVLHRCQRDDKLQLYKYRDVIHHILTECTNF